MSLIKSIARNLCSKCDTLEESMRKNLINILENVDGNKIIISDSEEISDDDIVLTVCDEGNYSYTLRVRAIELSGDQIYMIGDLDGEAGTYWCADSIEDYYWCLKFIEVRV